MSLAVGIYSTGYSINSNFGNSLNFEKQNLISERQSLQMLAKTNFDFKIQKNKVPFRKKTKMSLNYEL